MQGALRRREEVVFGDRVAPTVERQKKVDPALAWWSQNSKCAYQEAFRDLDRALRDFVASTKGKRKGRRLGFPKFKKRGRCRDSFRFGAGVMRCSGSTVTLSKLGTVGTHESTRRLARRQRARGAECWAVLSYLGRDGVAELVSRCCRLARRFAAQLSEADVEVLNDVVLNQAVVAFGDDRRTGEVIAAVQAEGTCWCGPTTWGGARCGSASATGRPPRPISTAAPRP